jgi:hypothetical protein
MWRFLTCLLDVQELSNPRITMKHEGILCRPDTRRAKSALLASNALADSDGWLVTPALYALTGGYSPMLPESWHRLVLPSP